jgi:hypothetical protein
MITFASSFAMGKACRWGKFSKCGATLEDELSLYSLSLIKAYDLELYLTSNILVSNEYHVTKNEHENDACCMLHIHCTQINSLFCFFFFLHYYYYYYYFKKFFWVCCCCCYYYYYYYYFHWSSLIILLFQNLLLY